MLIILLLKCCLETVKEQVTEERDIPFETLYTERNLLPKGEQELFSPTAKVLMVKKKM